jgi:hypothetical protein
VVVVGCFGGAYVISNPKGGTHTYQIPLTPARHPPNPMLLSHSCHTNAPSHPAGSEGRESWAVSGRAMGHTPTQHF